MDLFTIFGACLRRWYITAPLLLLVAFFSYRAYQAVDPLYTSSRSIVVLPSVAEEPLVQPEDEADATVEVDNPYSGQGGSRFAVAVLTRNINSAAFEERLELQPGTEQSYEAESSSTQPMIHVEAVGASPEAVYDLLDQVVAEAADVLDAFQAEAGAPEITRYRIAPAVPAGPAEDATPSRLRGAGAIAVLGSGLVAALVVGSDALLASQRRRRLEAPADSNESTRRATPTGGAHPAPAAQATADETAHDAVAADNARDDEPASNVEATGQDNAADEKTVPSEVFEHDAATDLDDLSDQDDSADRETVPDEKNEAQPGPRRRRPTKPAGPVSVTAKD